MKDKIGIVIVALVSILTSCFFTVGCTPAPGYITIDSRSEVMQPRFCMYHDPYFQQRLSIGRITVWKARRFPEDKNRWEFASPGSSSQLGSDTVWDLEYKSSDFSLLPIARQTFVELEARIQTLLRTDNSFYATQVLFGLGKTYMELGDEPTARRVFAQLFEIIKIELQESFIGYDAEIFYEDTLYELGKVYLKLGDETAAQRVFAQFLQHFSDSTHKPEVQRLLEKQ